MKPVIGGFSTEVCGKDGGGGGLCVTILLYIDIVLFLAIVKWCHVSGKKKKNI